MPRLIGRDGRLRVGLLLGVFLAASSVLALAVFFLLPRPTTVPGSTASPAASGGAEPSSSEILEGSYDPAPTGCLGGQARDTAMVLATQKKAGHSTFGAVEVAASFFRWGYRYPYPSAAEVRNLQPLYASGAADTLQQQFIADYKRSYDPPPGGDVEAGTPYYLTSANGVWSVDSASTKDRIIASTQLHYVIDGSYSTTQTVSLTAVLDWQGSAWHLSSLKQSDPQRLTTGGTSFTSGC